jgi:ABC-type sugar transport system substrate-binding protein
VKIVGKGETDCQEEKGINVAQDILTANPHVTAIYSACGPPAAGAAQAIKNAKLDHKVILDGYDFCCGEPDAMAAGIEDASEAQFPAKMSELGVDALVKAIRGEQPPSLIDSGAALVTRANMDKFK